MRKLVRTTAAAAGLAAALALTGCGGGGSDDASKDTAPSASPTTGGDDGDGDAGRGRDVEGTWADTSGSAGPVALSVQNGTATLVAEGHTCHGEVRETDKQMLALKCADGDTDRTTGTVESNDGTTLVVSWGSGKKDTLKKVDQGQLPDGLPTGIPTDFQVP
ncbi:hypothetical protein AB0903_24765 [Streptomyces sp. NPDC048389]|uniref:hypothetical protein n=1 Tax=Streptomyces sp. NPDC048389 TaxID=3154622 RepID=UPI00345579D6